MIWLAVIMVCGGQGAQTCSLTYNPKNYRDLSECQTEVNRALGYFYEQGVYAQGSCISTEIGLGV